MWSWPLTIQPQNHNTSIGYPKIFPHTKFEHYGIIRYVADKQTEKQIDSRRRTSMVHDSVGVGNDTLYFKKLN